MTNIIDDLTTLTNVPESIFKKFISVSNYSIGHAVHEGMTQHKDVVEIDLGIGMLHIKTDYSGIHYKFIPSKSLEDILIKTVTSKTSPIVSHIESDIQQRIEHTYKELL